jgi:hypothetical protein
VRWPDSARPWPSVSSASSNSVKGIKIGRPKLGIDLRQKIAQQAARGETAYAIAKRLGIDRRTAAKYAI